MSSHLHAQQVAQAYLSNIVANELVVLQVRAIYTCSAWALRRIGLVEGQSRFSTRSSMTTYHHGPSQRRVEASCVLESLWSSQALTPSRDHAFLCCGSSSVVLSVSQNLHRVAQFSLAEKKECLPTRVVRATVVGRLGRHVGEIQAFVKHVAIHRRFFRSNSEALSEDTTEVGSA